MPPSSTWMTKAGDTAVPLQFALSDALGAVDLTNTTVRFQMRKDGSNETKVDKPAIVNPDQTNYRGWVVYEWEAEDVDTPGLFLGEFKVTWPDNDKPSTFPNGEYYIEITIGEGVADIPAP